MVQIGQGRGGFLHRYSSLENLVGANIHNADRIASAWQASMSETRSCSAQNMPLDVVHVDPGSTRWSWVAPTSPITNVHL